MQEVIEIPSSKIKIILLILGSVAFVAIGAFMIFGDSIFIKVVGAIAILFFGLAGVYGCRKLFDTSVGLRIDSQGITEHTNATSIGLIPWEDITGIQTASMNSQRFILIYVADPEKYLQKASSKFIRKVMQANMKMCGTPVTISANTLRVRFKQLEQIVLDAYDQYQASL